MSSNQESAPNFSLGPLLQRDMVDLSKPASAIERTRSTQAEVRRSTPILISTSGSGTAYQPSARPFSFGPLSQNMIEPSNAQSSTPISTPNSSSTAHQSSPQNFCYGPYAPPLAHQTRNQRFPAQDKVENQAARIQALESGFDVLTDRYEKASGLAYKYGGLLKIAEKEYLDKIKASENNNALVLRKVAESYETQIKTLQDEKRTLEKLKQISVRDVLELGRKHSSLMGTNKEQVEKISSLTKTKAVLRIELTSSLTTIEGMKKKIEILTKSNQKWENFLVKIDKDNKELRAKNSEFETQNGDYLVTDRSEKDEDEDEVAVHVHDGGGQEEEAVPPPAKELEVASSPLSVLIGFSSSEKMEESSEILNTYQLHKDLRLLALMLLYYVTVFVVVWTNPI